MLHIFNIYIYIYDWKKFLKNNNFIKIKKYGKINFWPSHPKTYKCFFVGYRNGKKYFIKCSVNDKTIENEYRISDKIQELNFKFFCKIDCKLKFCKRRKMNFIVAYDFLTNVISFSDIPEEKRDLVVDQLNEIISFFNENHFYHCDISKRNILFDVNSSSLVLIDYGLSYQKDIVDWSVYSFEWYGSGIKYNEKFVSFNDSVAIKSLITCEWKDFNRYKKIISSRTLIYYFIDKSIKEIC